MSAIAAGTLASEYGMFLLQELVWVMFLAMIIRFVKQVMDRD